RGAALGRRQQLHAGDRRHQSDAAEPRAGLRGAERDLVELNPAVFKAYDIRGIHGEEIDEEIAHQVGRAFAQVLAAMRGKRPEELRIGLGRDMRLTSPGMAAELRDGLIFEGATVLDAGMVATEMLYYLVGSSQLDGGAMVTASHNPKAYTGVKLVRD